jgi:hypothetical protein
VGLEMMNGNEIGNLGEKTSREMLRINFDHCFVKEACGRRLEDLLGISADFSISKKHSLYTQEAFITV